ncbi:phage tail length tape measure family protein [Pseudomonas asiatica]|uniref:phage tail length tape measure family protein n=1 Tax=Pseudomonas asiatica TaxID=2219225 RepID=UPI001E645140|nr:phage tail length tape measure family protein [Pseudomonas asiatica]MCE0955071.1 phage tail length tape measure family protein [Pseudomonas asiatica]
MTQESRLAVTIDSRGAKRNADDLTTSLERMERAGDAAASSADGVSSSLDDQRKELAQLLGQINPTVAALGRLDDMQEKLAKLKKAGVVESDTFVEYTQRINTMREALGETTTSMNKAGMSAKAYQAALRGVPAQFTDIAVSLQGGQAPLTVFLQQGGQLKDMFGGVLPAAKALGGYVLGLVNPFTVAAAAAGTLALAYYKGSEESDRLTDAIIRNGNAAGTSYSELAGLAEQVAATGTTVGAASKVLEQLAGAGNALTPMYAQITKASLAWSKQTGEDVTKVVQSFNEIAKGPVEAVKKLDAELNFLTASQYANIISLEKQGRTIDAARAATDLYATALSTRSAEMESNLGSLESAWQSLGSFAKKAWDAMLDVGRKTTPEQELADVYNQIAEARKSIGKFGSAASSLMGVNPDSLKALEKRATELQGRIAEEGWKAWEGTTNRIVQDAGKKGVDLINSTFTAAQTQTQKLQKQLVDLDKARTDAMASGGFTAEQETKYATARKNIEQEIADIKTREAKKNAPKNVNRGVAEAENTFARLYGQYDPAAQAARALTKEQGQLDLALSKGKITQEEYSKALAQASLNYAAIVQGQDQHLVRLKQINEEYVKGQSLAELYAQKSAATEIQGPAGKIAQAGIDSSINNQVFSGKPNTSQIDAVIGGAGSELMRMTQENEQLQAWYDQRIAMYQQYRELEVENAAQYDETIRQLEKQRAEDTVNNERSMSVARLSLAEGMFGDLTSIVGAFAGQQSGAYKAMFAVQKAASIAQSIISIQTGIAMAAANPFPLNLAAMASVAAATASIVGNIQSVGLNLATGGYVRGPGTGTSDSIPANLSNGEFVVNAAATKRNRALLEAINSNERVSVAGGGGAVVSTQAGSSGASGIQQNIYIQNHTTAQVEQRRMPNGDLEFVIREATDRAVQEVAGQLASGYGDVVNAGEGAYGWKRPGD